MIKNLGRRKLSRTSSHKKAMMRNMATSLFHNEKVETTLAKAKELVGYCDRLLTKAIPSNVTARRAIAAEIQNKDVQKKIFDVLVPRYKERTSGHMKLFKTGNRQGDNAKTALVKLIS